MKRLMLVWVMILCLALGTCFPAGADDRTPSPKELVFVEAAEARFPGCRVMVVSTYLTSEAHVAMNLLGVADGMLQVIYVDAEADDPEGRAWDVRTYAPIPLTAWGAERAAEMLRVFQLSPMRYYYNSYENEFLTDYGLLEDAALFLTGKGETLVRLYSRGGLLMGLAENEEGEVSLRLAEWDGSAYGEVLASPMQSELYINREHSSDDHLELSNGTAEFSLWRREDGFWQLTSCTPYHGEPYSVSDDHLVGMEYAEYNITTSNDAYHYGTPAFGINMPEVDFAAVPQLKEAIPQLDAGGWACVKTEGAALYDAPEGQVLSTCFCRLPGRVLDRAEGWTRMQIGSEALGMTGWFRTEDLAFGAETETVICSFPDYDFGALDETPLAEEVCRRLKEEYWFFPLWLVGKTPAGDWLLLGNNQLVCTASPEVIGKTGPAIHLWEEEGYSDLWDEEDEGWWDEEDEELWDDEDDGSWDEEDEDLWDDEDQEWRGEEDADWWDDEEEETLIVRLETMGLTEVRMEPHLQDPFPCVLVSGRDAETRLRVVLRLTPCAMGVCVGDETENAARIPVSQYTNYLRTPGMEIPDQAEHLVQSELALAVQRQQTLASMPVLTGYAGKFPKGKSYAVYRGPGEEFGRSANGKASVSTNDKIMVYGIREDWVFVSYSISGGHTRWGWVSVAELPASVLETCPELVFPGDDGTDYVYATITDATFMTDLEGITNNVVSQVGLGASAHCLAVRPGWVLVEMVSTNGHFWGFIKQDYVDMEHGCAYKVQLSYSSEAHHTPDEIRSAAQAVARYYSTQAPGHTLLSLSYSADENRPENADWPTDVPEGIEWMKLHGTVRSIAYYDFEIAGPDGAAEDLVFYVWREPSGEWIGGLGGYE